MGDYIERMAAKEAVVKAIGKGYSPFNAIVMLPAADVRPVVTCAYCKHNNACLTQAFVEDASRVPFDRNTFFCADGKENEREGS